MGLPSSCAGGPPVSLAGHITGGNIEHVFAAVLERGVTAIEELAALLALTEAAPASWYEVADVVEEVGSARAVLAGGIDRVEEPRLAHLARVLANRVSDAMVASWVESLELLRRNVPGVDVVTVLDDHYPVNLRMVYNRPPFLFIDGELDAADNRAVAVVGTRTASDEGLAQARRLAGELAERGVTVISGMAAGIDTAAHTAALDAGGRTIAVMGTGIDRVYPAANRALSRRIAETGALVSQFWPGMPPRQQNFPLRNVVTSGIAVGTVVVEASHTSGAKMQARLALDHGKRVFLIESLVMHEKWARDYARNRGATVVSSVDDVLAALDDEDVEPSDQMALF